MTVILDFVDGAALCRQLEALFAQSARPAHVWVSSLGSVDGGAAARLVLAGFTNQSKTQLAVVGAAAHEGALNPFGQFRRLGCFQLALQAPTSHVLVLDANVLPGAAQPRGAAATRAAALSRTALPARARRPANALRALQHRLRAGPRRAPRRRRHARAHTPGRGLQQSH